MCIANGISIKIKDFYDHSCNYGWRLWPLSRKVFPKQFIALTSSLTMLQETAARLNGLSNAAPMVNGFEVILPSADTVVANNFPACLPEEQHGAYHWFLEEELMAS
jgi:hypothetical protein